MMTGIELALAIVPLVIAAVEHQKAIRRKGKALASSKEKNEQQLDFYHELSNELALLDLTLKGVKVYSASKSNNRPAPPEDGDIEVPSDAILKSLDERAQPFKEILHGIMENINILVSDKSLALSASDTKTSGSMFARLGSLKFDIENGGSPQTLKSRVHFTRHEKKRMYAMHQIRKHNKVLERLLRGTLDFVDQRDRPSRKRPPRTRTRRHSDALYSKIAGKWPRTCDCHFKHEARLCLWNCCSTEEHVEEHVVSDDYLDIVVSVADRDTEERRPSWQESTILVSDSNIASPSSRTVQFVVDGRPVSSSSPPPGPGRDIESESMCSLLRRAQTKNSKLHLVYENGKLWQRKARSMSLLNIRHQKDVPFRSLLVDQSRSWKLRDKWTLAVIMAHAALHCSESHWMSENWNKDHVSFFKSDFTKDIDLRRPFLTVDFRQVPPPEPSQEEEFFSAPSYQALENLGILLLEIYLSSPIEDHYSVDDLIDGDANEHTKITTALRVWDETNGDLYEGYRNAVKTCLNWNVGNIGRGDDDVQKLMYETIVEPLEIELERGFNLKPEDLRLVDAR
ncbi:hypothetical protein K491DRAFT_757659 [Lophiostoma macrostomum CBS 122681]|uniref:DUF7580 domain-containing protein n=1 Tax=Lophiostoma macrostomum CBS 122681 TaxID=1314788 RepID=A0A6A6T9G2_9PLEO|nr:hypothetical protein K491DRAFT_757659 [Lophiostoma macrostomum CBS 122681]